MARSRRGNDHQLLKEVKELRVKVRKCAQDMREYKLLKEQIVKLMMGGSLQAVIELVPEAVWQANEICDLREIERKLYLEELEEKRRDPRFYEYVPGELLETLAHRQTKYKGRFKKHNMPGRKYKFGTDKPPRY